MTLLYSGDAEKDIKNILTYIDEFTANIGVTEVHVEITLLSKVIKGLYYDFPCIDGLENASVFKQLANFATYFIAERPIQTVFPKGSILDPLFSITNHQNAIIAFAICLDALHEAKIVRQDGTKVTLDNPITLSKHSYIDIIEALAVVSPSTHFKLLTVFFEQLAYKANPDAQYEQISL